MSFIDSSNKFNDFFEKSSKKRDINVIVLHHIEANSLEHALEQLKAHKVSSHFIINEEGIIYKLVEEEDVAYHAGFSFWNGIKGINKCSIGIEFINKSPFKKKFTENQLKSGLELCKYLIEKYKIEPKNIVGHSDIAYCDQNLTLNRKQDPSHLFNWKFLAENGVGIYQELNNKNEIELFKIGHKNDKIRGIKEKLSVFGYKISNFNDEFDQEMQCLSRVFNRRFLNKESDIWYDKSSEILEYICLNY